MRAKVTKRLLRRVMRYKWLLCGSFFGALLFVPLGLLGPVFIGRAVDAAVGAEQVDFTAIAHNLLLLISVVCSAALLQWIMQVCTRRISAQVAQDVRQEAFDRLNRVPLARIDTHRHGDIVNRLINDTDAIAEGLMQALTQLFPGVITIIATIVLMLALNTAIALMVIVATPLSILFARLVTRRTGRMFVRQSVAQGEMSAFVGEMVGGQELLQLLGSEGEAAAEFEKVNHRYFDESFKATLYSSLINPGTRFINALVYAAVCILGAILAVRGGITVGGLSAFLAYANQYTRPFNEVTAVFTQLQAALAGAERLFEVIDWDVEPEDVPEAIAPAHSEGRVTAQGISFSYTKERPLIRNFNMTALPGQRIALVGPTGCGKTTIINLLMRFYDIESGRLCVDDVDTTKIKRDALRGLYGMVLQDTWLKNDTVSANIAYGNLEATHAEVERAARAAHAHSFIKRLPQGYKTVIKTGGEGLSSGQRQLLCIARIMLSRPDILILDEATSSIDTRTEMLIQSALEKLMMGRTSFIVAHRLSTIQNADIILVMDAGRVVERGNHAQLLAQGGFYAKLYNSQFVHE